MTDLKKMLENIKKQEQESKDSLASSHIYMKTHNPDLESDIEILQAKYPNVISDITIHDDMISLDFLYSIEKRKGHGTAFLNDLITIADNHQIYIILEPVIRNEDEHKNLIRFYEKFGFELNDGDNEMLRKHTLSPSP